MCAALGSGACRQRPGARECLKYGKTCSSDFTVDVKLLVPSVPVQEEFTGARSIAGGGFSGPTVAPGDPRGGAGPPSPALRRLRRQPCRLSEHVDR